MNVAIAHLAHYASRRVVEPNYSSPGDPWFSKNQPEDQGFEAPSYHVTRSTSGPAARVSPGDTLWIFSQLRSPWGSFPPALDAKISVAKVEDLRKHRSDKEAAFQFYAGAGSSWFPLFDATMYSRDFDDRFDEGDSPAACPCESADWQSVAQPAPNCRCGTARCS